MEWRSPALYVALLSLAETESTNTILFCLEPGMEGKEIAVNGGISERKREQQIPRHGFTSSSGEYALNLLPIWLYQIVFRCDCGILFFDVHPLLAHTHTLNLSVAYY